MVKGGGKLGWAPGAPEIDMGDLTIGVDAGIGTRGWDRINSVLTKAGQGIADDGAHRALAGLLPHSSERATVVG
jgi:hypothetical protein